MASPLVVSLSAVSAFDACEQRYYWQYIRGLKRIDKGIPLSRGTILHHYLEMYYSGVKDTDFTEAQLTTVHNTALASMAEVAEQELLGYRQAAEMMRDDSIITDILGMPAACTRIAERYFQARGKRDAEKYEILFVERRVVVELSPGIHSVGVIDLVLKERATGKIFLCEHKTTGRVPSEAVRLLDLQTLLYAEKLYAISQIKIDGIIWNYLMTVEPTAPETLKNGTITRRKNLNSTWSIYEQTLLTAGEDPLHPKYDEMRERLANKELDVFFPRIETVTMVDTERILTNYIDRAAHIKQKIALWKSSAESPHLALGRNCAYCAFTPLCTAMLTFGDVEDAIHLRYASRNEDAKALQDEEVKERMT